AVAQGFLAEATHWGEEADVEAARLIPADADGPRVLVVDDNADIREYVAGLLANENYVVTTAVDGLDGLDLARQHVPDLVLTDVMMPRLDGFGLLRELHGDPATQHIPVVMLSARAGDEAVVEGLEAGADDYLPKPFSARELRARVRANLELDRIRRTGAAVEHSRVLLDQAQRLAGVGSWESDIPANTVLGSPEFLRQVGVTADELASLGIRAVMDELIHPDDRDRVDEALRQTVESGVPYDVEVRLRAADGGYRLYRSRGEVERDATGAVVRMLGSQQDVTEQRAAQVALAEAAATAEAATREHRVADELQRHLLPQIAFAPELLEVSTFYRAGVAGTQVGGDWYDVIELGAGRTALVLGDVMGRGVRAAAVMGQLRAAVRAYARLDLPPADVLEFLDGVVRDLGEDQIVTCVYAVYDPADRSLSYANAGHLPPLVVSSDGIDTLGVSGPPLGSGPLTLVEERVVLPGEATLVLYTDGLVERRDRDIDRGVEMLAASLLHQTLPVPDLPDYLVRELLPDGPDDDVAVLVARVPENESRVLAVSRTFEASTSEVAVARDFVSELLVSWAVGDSLRDEVVLLVSELVTNAVIHGRGPVEVRLRRSPVHLVLEVHDGATCLPRRLRPDPEDEHGRGIQLVALLASRWGTRPTPDGKVVWATFSLTP
ncbi:MAG: SpoIIE family protein phosphatase, partial [Actinomycetes bacterium]